MNIPNRLTILRILIIPLLVAALLIDTPHHFLIAGILFAIASTTDYFDGKIARERNLVTDFGKFADPLADKLLVISSLLCFIELGLAGSVMVIIVLFREFSVTSIRLLAASKGTVVAANMWGKSKTVSQIIAIALVFVLQYLLELMQMQVIHISSDALAFCAFLFFVIGKIGLWISTILALVSGVIYIKDNKHFISDY